MYYVDVRENVGNRQNRDCFDQCVSRKHFLSKRDINNSKSPEHPTLPEESFILAFQTEFQLELYKQHASTILCIDSTHGTNQYRFKLITVVVPDDLGKGQYVHVRVCVCVHSITRNHSILFRATSGMVYL